MTPSGIEPATFRFVAQHLNHCATAVPKPRFKGCDLRNRKYIQCCSVCQFGSTLITVVSTAVQTTISVIFMARFNHCTALLCFFDLHPCVIAQKSVTRCTIMLNIFISLLYMFRAFTCPSSGENYCIYATLVFVSLYGWRLGFWLGFQPNQQTRRHPYRLTNTSVA